MKPRYRLSTVVTPEMFAALEAASIKSGNSLSQEIRRRLAKSLKMPAGDIKVGNPNLDKPKGKS
jgi:hypothetical protein